MSSLRTQVISGLRWTASARLVSQVITWSITLLVIRILTPADYGLLAMAMVLIGFLAMFSEFGLGPALIQAAKLDERILRQAFGAILLINLSLAALLALAAPLVGAFFSEPQVTPVIRVLSVQFVIGAFAVIPNAQLMRRMEFRHSSLLDLSTSIVASLSTLAMASAGAGVWALVVGSIISQTCRTIGINYICPFMHWPELSPKGLRSLLTFGGHMTLAQIFGNFFAQSDLIIAAKVLGNDILGSYAVGVQLASMPCSKISSLVNAVAFPAFSSMQNDLQKVSESVLLGIRFLSFFAFPVLWGMSSIAPEIAEVILGLKWTSAIMPLQMLALIVPFRIIGNFVGTSVQGLGRPDIVLRQTIWACLIGPLLLFIGAYSGGLIGLSSAWLLVSPLLFLPFLVRSVPVLGLRVMQPIAAMMPAAGTALVMYGAVTLTRHLFLAEQGGVLRLCVLVGVGALVYGIISFVGHRKGTREVLAMLTSIAGTKQSKPTEE